MIQQLLSIIQSIHTKAKSHRESDEKENKHVV